MDMVAGQASPDTQQLVRLYCNGGPLRTAWDVVLVILWEFRGQLPSLCKSWVLVVCIITVIAALEYSIRCPSGGLGIVRLGSDWAAPIHVLSLASTFEATDEQLGLYLP